jgi:putative FmdB family regulatory protein
MPTYTYKCAKCSKVEDVFHPFSEDYSSSCECGGKMNKVFYPSGISFKGSGFYSNDSKGK